MKCTLIISVENEEAGIFHIFCSFMCHCCVKKKQNLLKKIFLRFHYLLAMVLILVI